jgi:hypothetical protein
MGNARRARRPAESRHPYVAVFLVAGRGARRRRRDHPQTRAADQAAHPPRARHRGAGHVHSRLRADARRQRGEVRHRVRPDELDLLGGQVHPALREDVRRLLRYASRGRVHERHIGAPARALHARNRGGRRGRHPDVHDDRDGEHGSALRRDARLRRRRGAHVEPRSRPPGGGDHAAYEGDRARPHLRPSGRYGRDPRCRPAAGYSSSRMQPRPTARRSAIGGPAPSATARASASTPPRSSPPAKAG